jgi:hypothetical protein
MSIQSYRQSPAASRMKRFLRISTEYVNITYSHTIQAGGFGGSEATFCLFPGCRGQVGHKKVAVKAEKGAD